MNTKMTLKDAIHEVDSAEPLGCPKCWSGGLKKTRLVTFEYAGSVLGPFTVKNAQVLKCDSCGIIRYPRAASKRWEVHKALEIALQPKLMSGVEFKFLRYVLGKTIDELSKLLGVDKSTISRWENGKSTAQAQAQLRNFFIYQLIASDYLQLLRKRSPTPRIKHFYARLEKEVAVHEPKLFSDALNDELVRA